MTKKLAVINDLSGFGRCSLTAAISVISAMGVQPCPLPTAILSGQTGYPSYYCDDYTDKMELISHEWEKMGAEFAGICTGFVCSEQQIEHIFDFVKTFRRKETFLLVDPVMGDNGKAYSFFTDKLCGLMKKLACSADIIVPNLTELCLLSGTDYGMIDNLTDEKQIQMAVEQMAKNLISRGPKLVVVTGIRFYDEFNKIEKVGNLAITEKQSVYSSFPYIGGSYSGTGDLFASVIAASIARGDELSVGMELAGEFIEQAIGDSVKENVSRNDGVNYEQYLWMLAKKTYL